jgi:aldehyde dehydrogenase (NAD+)
VQQDIYDEFVGRCAEAFTKLRVGTPEMNLDCGPVMNATQRDKIQAFTKSAIDSGIPLLAQGAFAKACLPAVLDQACVVRPVPRNHALACQEVFGPVLSAIPFKDEDDAVRLANETEYGLIAPCGPRRRAQQRVSKRMRCGQVFINCYGAGGGVELRSAA